MRVGWLREVGCVGGFGVVELSASCMENNLN